MASAIATVEVEVRSGPTLKMAMGVAKLAAAVAELLSDSLTVERDELRDKAAEIVQHIATELDRTHGQMEHVSEVK